VQGDHCTGVAYVEPDSATRAFDLRVAQSPQQRYPFGPGKSRLFIEQFGQQLFIFRHGDPCL
jgi:hypothetical protein